MLARLGFSVAAHMDPEVLLVDEVLSVGDMSFQAKCIARMQESIRQGVTVAFVSHNLQAVASLCSRVIVLAGGQLIADGDPAASLDAYLKASQQSPGGQGDATQPTSLVAVEFKTEGNKPAQVMAPHTPCEMTVTLRFNQDVQDFNIGFIVERTSDLLYCYGASTEECGIPLFRCRAGETLRVRFRFSAHFARGHYRINLNLRNSKASKFAAVFDNVAGFAIDEHVTYSGVVDIGLNVAVERLAVEPA
jgi:lipopolysaccharide transport system ATP-binding protein